MARQKVSKTNYQINKGVNQKTSKYTIADAQVTELFNMDFFNPNALSKRPGQTLIISQNFSGAINSLFEFQKLGGQSYMMVGTNTDVYARSATGVSLIASGYNNNQPFDFVAFTDRAFFTNGQTFLSWTGFSLYQYSLPTPSLLPSISRNVLPPSFIASLFGYPTTGVTTILIWRFTFQRTDGFESPASGDLYSQFLPPSNGQSRINFGDNVGSLIGSIPPNVNFINMYMAHSQSVLGLGGVSYGQIIDGETLNISFLPEIPATAFRLVATFSSAQATTVFLWTQGVSAPNFPQLVTNGKVLPEFDFSFSNQFTPRFVEVNQNRFFMAGFSNAPSIVYFSEIGEPELVQPESFFEVRTDDGDRITAIYSFIDELIIFKTKSFSKLVGDSADNYALAELSTEFGCVSNKAVIEYNNTLLFLDEKGIVQYNGANWELISYPVEPIFRRMNVINALDKAVAVHYSTRNQIWFSFPIDNSTENNFTVVYDYLLQAWTFFDGFNVGAHTMAKQQLSNQALWRGDYSGNVFHFSPSFYSDNGSGFTCKIKTKFDSPDGANIQNMFRRLFLDVNTVSGITGTIDVKVLSDYSDTTKATFAIYQNQFQTRRDFGVQGKAVAFEMAHNNASLPFDLYGFTVQRRYIRNV
jgi:hypothetical protein